MNKRLKQLFKEKESTGDTKDKLYYRETFAYTKYIRKTVMT